MQNALTIINRRVFGFSDCAKPVLFLLFSLLVFGCAQKPTKVKVVKQTPDTFLVENLKRPVKVTAKTVVVDSRSRFEYQMAHHPGAVHLRWESFTNKQAEYPGRLLEDRDKLIKRLAAKGMHPRYPVIVVGEGADGDGSAGRLAWTLFYLGLENIQVVGKNTIALSSNVDESPEKQNQKLWQAPDNSAMIADTDRVYEAVSAKPASGKRSHVIIDVRSEREYFKKKGFGRNYALPDLGALNIEWKEFYNENGRPNVGLRKRLSGIGVGRNTKIILMSDKGVRSAAAHFALSAMGFKNVSTYLDGYSGLTKHRAVR